MLTEKQCNTQTGGPVMKPKIYNINFIVIQRNLQTDIYAVVEMQFNLSWTLT